MIIKRPDASEYFLTIARVVSTRATCSRRRVGCVLTNEHNHIVATGYNGPPANQRHCFEDPCPGADLPSGTGLTQCESVHAEINALMQCRDVQKIHAVYCTTAPCSDCVKALLNTSAQYIVFSDPYPHPESEERWRRAGRFWFHHQMVIDAKFPNLLTSVSAIVKNYGVI